MTFDFKISNDLMKHTRKRIFIQTRRVAEAVVDSDGVLGEARRLTKLVYLLDAYKRDHKEAQKRINSQRIRELKQYIYNQQPLKTRIEFSKHETEVAWTDNQRHKERAKNLIHAMVRNQANFINSNIVKREYWAIAGRAYEEAKAVVA